MKKVIAVILAAVLALLLCSCGDKTESKKSSSKSGKKRETTSDVSSSKKDKEPDEEDEESDEEDESDKKPNSARKPSSLLFSSLPDYVDENGTVFVTCTNDDLYALIRDDLDGQSRGYKNLEEGHYVQLHLSRDEFLRARQDKYAVYLEIGSLFPSEDIIVDDCLYVGLKAELRHNSWNWPETMVTEEYANEVYDMLKSYRGDVIIRGWIHTAEGITGHVDGESCGCYSCEMRVMSVEIPE